MFNVPCLISFLEQSLNHPEPLRKDRMGADPLSISVLTDTRGVYNQLDLEVQRRPLRVSIENNLIPVAKRF
jgi:hypothetical protein